MPRTVTLPAAVAALVTYQDGVASNDQLRTHGIDRAYTQRRIGSGRWSRLLPGIVLTSTGEPTRRQRVIAAWLWGGADAAIDGADACAWYGLGPDRRERNRVHIVIPWQATARSHGFVVVRRTVGPITTGATGKVPYVDLGTALVVAARNSQSWRDGVSVLSRGLQTGRVSRSELLEARERIGDKWCRGVDRALVAVGVGVRSPAEKDAADLYARSRILPTPRWNVWLDLGDGGGCVCVDSLWPDAGMVNEINGKRYHAWGDQFERTEERRARLIAAELIALGCTPSQIRRSGAAVLERLERSYVSNAGRGMPPGVRIVPPPHSIAE
jgi:hypothetical protein